MQIFSADYIFPVSSAPVKNGLVVVDDEGVVLDVLKSFEPVDRSKIEVHKGIIVPGFVNAHCHLELSHMKGVLKEKTQLTGFVSEILSKRETLPADSIQPALVAAEKEMIEKGIVAVGDISNTDHTFNQKLKKNLAYHTFLEVFDIHSKYAEGVFDTAATLQKKFPDLYSTITPHAPYTVSTPLIKLINEEHQEVLSVHNQETASEDNFCTNGSGEMADFMKKAGTDLFPSGKTAMVTTLTQLTNFDRILLIHNTYTSKQDFDFLTSHIPHLISHIYFCFCPNANLFIEDRLPDIPLFIKEGAKICLGTDSYASNWSLSVLDEMKTIAKHFPFIPFSTLLLWATLNGAEALGFDKQLGSIEKNKKPGLNLLQGLNANTLKISENVQVRKLI